MIVNGGGGDGGGDGVGGVVEGVRGVEAKVVVFGDESVEDYVCVVGSDGGEWVYL